MHCLNAFPQHCISDVLQTTPFFHLFVYLFVVTYRLFPVHCLTCPRNRSRSRSDYFLNAHVCSQMDLSIKEKTLTTPRLVSHLTNPMEGHAECLFHTDMNHLATVPDWSFFDDKSSELHPPTGVPPHKSHGRPPHKSHGRPPGARNLRALSQISRKLLNHQIPARWS